MSKGNLFMGQARGKVGDVVFTRTNGEQVARSHNPSPKNPRSPLQILQRICFNTASKAYSLLQDICNHSFEGLGEGTPNQSAFIRLNTEWLRSQLAIQISMPTDEVMLAASAFNYNQKGDTHAELNTYVISRGSLPTLLYAYQSSSLVLIFPAETGWAGEAPTYAEITSALGLQQGDQLTFCIVTKPGASEREDANGFKYARIILEPADGDMSLPFLTQSGTRYVVTQPNPKNEGLVYFGAANSNLMPITMVNHSETGSVKYALGAVIASRYTNGRWLRSSQSLIWMSASSAIPNSDTFGDAYLTYMQGASSSLYLNQAGI